MIRARRGSARNNGVCTNCGCGGEKDVVTIINISGFEVRLCDRCFQELDLTVEPLVRHLRRKTRRKREIA